MTADLPKKQSISAQVRNELISRFSATKSTLSSRGLDAIAPVSIHPSAQNIPDAFCRFDSFEEFEKIRLSQITARRLGIGNPFFKTHDGAAGAETIIEGRRYINFSSYNYLGLSHDPRVNAAAKAAIEQYGTSASASRLVAGERPIQRQLETELARTYDTEDCVVFVSGHATNVTSIGTLFGPKDLIIHDALIHNSVLEGIRLSGAARRSFAHNDPAALEDILKETRSKFERVLICVEGLYSMDGDIADLPQFIAIKNRYKALLMVDDAHSFGVLGEKGKGAREHFNLSGSDVDIWMGTLSKTLAGCGGYICGVRPLIEHLKYASGGFVYSVGIAPMLAAASLEALRILQKEPERVTILRERSLQLLNYAREKGIDTGTAQGYAIIPAILKSSVKAVTASNKLYDAGINIQPIIYPAVEERSARLRFFVSSMHSETQIKQAVDALVRVV
jgi:8-amino-7-oxononanoate synthase